MGALDRFGGPEAWEVWCREHEPRIPGGASCGTCARCELPDPRAFGDTGIGWCREAGEFVLAGDAPAITGCDDWEAR